MRKDRLMKTMCAVSAMGMLLTGCGKENETTTAPATAAVTTEAATAEATTEKQETTEAVSETTEETTTEKQAEGEMVIPEGYRLYWNDEFDGTELSKEDWNYEAHEVGWVNHELQEYVPSSEYAFVKDGELIIQPTKEVDANGNVHYTSGRVNTQGKHDIKYGWIEARIRVPQGTGYLPAFWMMPLDEQYYGQWPKCGEIDIMEVLGNNITTNYGTIHYGEPHRQNQGTYTLETGDFANEYHTYALEWMPGLIRWYVDGNMYYETNDWFTAVEGEEEKPYPAPFNQPFHVILNVAVGGDWPGNPDENTPFDDRGSMHVDYVRMFQKDSYDENVSKPVRDVVWKEADATGNYVTNGDFAVAEDLTDDSDWKFMAQNDGVGSAEIKDGEIIIKTENAGSEEYSIQLVQPGMPMVKGKKYKLSFEAYADEERQMKPAITAPFADWIRYLEDTPIKLTKDWQNYEFEFEMTANDDERGRVEFNMGKQGSTATIHIRNVRLENVE